MKDGKNIYIVDLAKRLIRTSNVLFLIYLGLNVGIITGVLLLLDLSTDQALCLGVLLYVAGVAVALSPIGEFILRIQTGCNKITDKREKAYIMPLFLEVYLRARIMDSSIPEDVRLFINEEEKPNAFATGRKTICVTRGIMKLPPMQIKAVLAHEFGHLAHKDTDLILLVSVGNFFVSSILLVFKIILGVLGGFVGTLSSIDNRVVEFLLKILSFVARLVNFVIIKGLAWIWTKTGVLLVMKSRRENEYEADAFACRLGLGDALCACLARTSGRGKQGLLACLVSSHPSSEERIERIRGSEFGT